MKKLTEKEIEKIRKAPEKANWYYISKYQKLSEAFIREFHEYVIWGYIFHFQELSESFIRQFHDRVWWSSTCRYQKLSEAFLIEFIGEIYTYSLKLNRHIPQEIKDKIIAMKELMNQ